MPSMKPPALFRKHVANPPTQGFDSDVGRYAGVLADREHLLLLPGPVLERCAGALRDAAE